MPFWSGIKFSTSALEFTIKKIPLFFDGPVMILSHWYYIYVLQQEQAVDALNVEGIERML